MRTSIVTTGTLSASLFFVASTVSAAPTIFPRTGNRLAQVTNSTTSTILADSQDPSTLYVMPPSAGKASLANVTYSANVGFCSELKDLQVYSRNLAQRISGTYTEIDTYGHELDRLLKEKGEFNQQAEGVKASSRAVKEVIELQDNIEDIEKRIDSLREAREKCPGDDDKCRDDIRNEIDTLKAEKERLKEDLRTQRMAASDALRDFERLQGEAKAVQDQIDDLSALIDRRTAFISKGRDHIWDIYKNLARIDGGAASVDFKSGWSDNVRAVKAANTSFNVTPIPTQDVRVTVSLVPGLGTDNYLSSLPMILDMSIGGQPCNPHNPFQTLPSIPELVTATVRMSLLGACAQKSPADFDIAKTDQGLPVYGLAETYQYPSTFRTRVTAKVNMWRAYSHMKKVTTHGGFFSSTSKSEVKDNTSGDSFVEITTFDESDLSRDQVDKLEAAIKHGTSPAAREPARVPRTPRAAATSASTPPRAQDTSARGAPASGPAVAPAEPKASRGASLPDLVERDSSLADTQLTAAIDDVNQKIERRGLIQRANEGTLDEEEREELRLLLRRHSALQVVRAQRLIDSLEPGGSELWRRE